jgi:hypothetical protein
VKNHFSVAKSLTHLLDEQFKIGRFSIGFDPLLDFIPGIGTFMGLLLSFYIIWIAKQVQVTDREINVMIVNVVFDFFIGLIPFLGFVGDALFKANKKNLKILEKYIYKDAKTILDAEIIPSSASV